MAFARMAVGQPFYTILSRPRAITFLLHIVGQSFLKTHLLCMLDLTVLR